MAGTTWEIGDRFRTSDRFGDHYTGTVVQLLDDGLFLFGRWRVRDGKRVASYGVIDPSKKYGLYKKAEPKPAPKGTAREWQALFIRAHTAGLEAGETARPVPMVVGTPRNVMASLTGGDDGGFDPNEPTYYVSEGVCGFAWVTVHPGNSSFARWLVKTDKGGSAYGGGVSIWVRYFGQSMARKEAYAGAFAKVLTEAGITAYSGSRMD